VNVHTFQQKSQLVANIITKPILMHFAYARGFDSRKKGRI